MPILVQWKWQEKTKSFLVIFHFYDDYSKTNLRIKNTLIEGKHRSLMTWAPSHVELALLAEMLRYANVIDGLDESAKRELRKGLEIMFVEDKQHAAFDNEALKALTNVLPSRKKIHLTVSLHGKKGFEGSESCVELCAEYVDYLKAILEPHFR